MQKYKTLPLTATGLKVNLFSLISWVFISASAILFLTTRDLVLVLLRISIKSVSSNKLVFEVVNFYNNILSKSAKDFLLAVTSFIKLFKLSSKILYFFVKTTDRSYCSSPFWVTVKSMIVVFADNSGENFGLDNLHVMNRLKFLWKSVN